MHEAIHKYHHGETELHGYLAYDDSIPGEKPAVLIVHDWTGRNDFACDKARQLAGLGMLGFALDMYGEARLGRNNEEKAAMMTPLIENRLFLRERILAAYETLKALPEVDSSQVFVIGYCFGGLCALDLARMGADVKAAVSFHGLLSKPDELKNSEITAKILVLHGYADPMVSPEQVQQFCGEMTDARVDWQVHMYGHTLHSFSNPQANDPGLGTVYNEQADKRSWQAMLDFFQEMK